MRIPRNIDLIGRWRLVALWILVAFNAAPKIAFGQELVDRIAAVVEGEPILLSEVRAAMAPFTKSLEGIKDPDRRAEKEPKPSE